YFCIEILAVSIRPPVFQIAVAVKSGTAIVETMRNFVANYRSYSTEINGRICFKIEKRRLKNGGRKYNIIVGRTVIRIDGLRRHGPFFFIYRLSYLCEIPLIMPGR